MPAINPGAGGSNGPPQRTTFRPPWVKEGPEPLPMPTAPWTLARTRQRGSEQHDQGFVVPNLKPVPRKNSATTNNASADSASNSSGPSEPAKTDPAPVRKTSKITIIPSRPSVDGAVSKENGHDVSSTTTANSKPNSRTTQAAAEPKPSKQQVKQIPIEIKSTTKPKQEEQKQKSSMREQTNKVEQKNSIKEQEKPKPKEEIKPPKPKEETKPPKPPAPPMPPPPMPGMESKPISENMKEKLEILRSRPRRRPDWGTLMKEIETGNKGLKHVQCNDRSSPLLPKVKVKDSFMYESERPNVHNLLLKEIQSGVKLKRVQTNDRSKPQLDGLRKFRRQLTIEEQIQKAEAVEVEVEPDELDDIDKVRDDLQSTKQMLALELRNKEATERENKKLLARILNLEVELEKAQTAKKSTEDQSPQLRREEDEQEKQKLKKDLEEAHRTADEMETKYYNTAGELDMVKSDLEEALRKNQILEKKLQASILNQDMDGEQPLRKQPSSKKLAALASAKESRSDMQKAMEQQSNQAEDEESEYEEVTETETESSEEEEEDTEALKERRIARELKLLATKLKSFKEKEETARKERRSLRDQLKKQQKILKEEKKKYKILQKEVDKMANLMKDDEEEEEESEEEEPEESESESESESEESEEESDDDLPPDSPAESRKQNLTERAKRHENCLAALRKGNYLLKANIDRIKDDLFKQKEMALTLQEDLNSVLAELG
ncbi:glutamic acid-rich protein-like isoform X2 [Periplaneta americana]